MVREARAAGSRLRVVGARSVERFGQPLADGWELVSTGRLGWIEVAAGDFTARVGAGVNPAELDAALQPLGLVWPLRRLEGPGTVGGLIASGRGTTIAAQDAPARRWVLGARLVDGAGEVLSVGGATVKNSVGYGLTHALWGSEGRLGAVVELTLRLRRRRPDDDPGETLDGDAVQAATALVRCDDLAPGTVAQALDGLLGCRGRRRRWRPRTECGWLGATPRGRPPRPMPRHCVPRGSRRGWSRGAATGRTRRRFRRCGRRWIRRGCLFRSDGSRFGCGDLCKVTWTDETGWATEVYWAALLSEDPSPPDRVRGRL